jgi:hypothetical protein
MSAISYPCFEKDFMVEKRLGKGNCSVVNQVFHIPEQKYYALKVTELPGLEELSQCINEL